MILKKKSDTIALVKRIPSAEAMVGAKKIRLSLLKEPEPEPPPMIRPEDMLSSGSALLNMAISDDPEMAFMKGKYVLIVGDSSSGKTFFSMTCMAEAARNPNFDGYDLYYDNVEDGMLIDVERFFGAKVRKRLKPPAVTKAGEPIFSETIEDFYYRVDDIVKKKRPFIYVLDSMDGLDTDAAEKKFEAQKKAQRSGAKEPGSYGDGKAKKNSEGLRRLIAGIRETGSILIVISQTRDNLTGWGDPKTRSGGKALRFYATTEFWLSVGKPIIKDVRGEKRNIGHRIIIKVAKNRINGKKQTVEVAIYPSYGIDDTGSCIDFLVKSGWWKKGSDGIHAKELDMTAPRGHIIKACENGKASKLRRAVSECWRAIESESELKRKPRYD